MIKYIKSRSNRKSFKTINENLFICYYNLLIIKSSYTHLDKEANHLKLYNKWKKQFRQKPTF